MSRFALEPEELEEYRSSAAMPTSRKGTRTRPWGNSPRCRNGTGPVIAAAAIMQPSPIERGDCDGPGRIRGLESDENFRKVVPFYVAENTSSCKADCDELNTYVKPLLEDPEGTKHINKSTGLAGEANYRRGDCRRRSALLQERPNAPVWNAVTDTSWATPIVPRGMLSESPGRVRPGGQWHRQHHAAGHLPHGRLLPAKLKGPSSAHTAFKAYEDPGSDVKVEGSTLLRLPPS